MAEINTLARLANERPGEYRVIVEENEAVELVACLYHGKNYGPYDRATTARAAAMLRAASGVQAMQQAQKINFELRSAIYLMLAADPVTRVVMEKIAETSAMWRLQERSQEPG